MARFKTTTLEHLGQLHRRPESFHRLTASCCAAAAWSYPSIVANDANKAKIDAWIALAPDTRVVETEQHGDRWTTQALEDGEVRYEETDFGVDEPELNLLAAWCARQSAKIEPRPPAKTTGAPVPAPLKRSN